MNNGQIKDMRECERMAENGRDKDCSECSCSVCLAKLPERLSANEYQKDCLRTARALDSEYLIMSSTLGIGGEAGEVIDLIKKWRYHDHEFNCRDLALELGDILYYLATMAKGINYDLETIMAMNVDKRKGRYPNGFDPLLSIHREEAR